MFYFCEWMFIVVLDDVDLRKFRDVLLEKKNFEVVDWRSFNVASFAAGLVRLKRCLVRDGFLLRGELVVNKGRYVILRCEQGNLLVMFKREPFFNFGLQFREQGMKGVGDSVNCLDLRLAVQHDVVWVYTIYPTGAVYRIALQDFVAKSVKWKNKEGKEVRSVSIHEYQRVYSL